MTATGASTDPSACGEPAAAGTIALRTSHSFFWRKLHSFTGVFPIGAFLAAHFWSNSYALVSPGKYDDVSRGLQQIPWRVPVEALVIWLPILFHGFYGLYIWSRGKSNVSEYPWVSNWMYVLQRWSGLVALVFIAWHVYTERFLTQGRSTYTGVAEALSNPYYFWCYVIGVVATSFHLGNGLWNFICKWGLASTVKSQRAAAYLGMAVAVAFTLIGLAIVISFRYQWRPFEFYTLPPTTP